MILTPSIPFMNQPQIAQGWSQEPAILSAPYCDLPSAKLLRYFQTRKNVRYFAIRDEEQANRTAIEGILVNRFDYNDEPHLLRPGFDWTVNPSVDIEWLILLHKFYFSVGLGEEFINTGDPRYAQKWVELTEAWIDTVPLDFMPSDVTGRRVQNWIFAHYYFLSCRNVPGITPEFYQKFLCSLHQQISYLRDHLTPKRNHRTIELYAIFLAAVVFPEFADAAEWLNFARDELVQNIQSDLRADGVHCEQSTDYHHLVVKNYLGVKRLAALNGIAFPPIFDELLQKALDFVMYAHKPDGDIPSLSDGDARSFLDLLQQGYEIYGNRAWLYMATRGEEGVPPTDRSRLFPASGYTILRSGWGEGETPFADERYLIFDCGPLGEGNHGHFDLLNFEMAAFGQSLIVDPGRYTYHEPHPDSDEINWRVLFRGTAYHNTVQVDGKNQTRYEFYKRKFKIRGPEPEWRLHEFLSAANFDFVHGLAISHEYEPIHKRTIFFANRDYWIVTDTLRADQGHNYDLRFHLSDAAQGKTTVQVDAETQIVRAPHLLLARPTDVQTRFAIEEGFVSRTYGLKQPAPVVRCTQFATNTVFHTVLYPYQAECPAIKVERLPIWHNDRLCMPQEATALRVTITHEGYKEIDTLLQGRPSSGAYHVDDITCYGSLLFVRRRVEIPAEEVAIGNELAAGHITAIHGRPGTRLTIDGRMVHLSDRGEAA